MAKFDLIIGHIINFEGGHSADPDDNALKLGHSGVLGREINPANNQMYDARYKNNYIHTNKGIIYATYKNYKRQRGETPTASEFLQMSKNLWINIYKTLFWDFFNLDKVNSQAIAEAILSAHWGGGGKILVSQLQSYLNAMGERLVINGNMNTATINAINKNLNTKKKLTDAINFLYNKRMAYLRSLRDWRKYGKGWTRRMNEELKRYLDFINKSAPVFPFFFLVPIGVYFLYKYIKK